MDSIKGILRRVFILILYLSPFSFVMGGTLAHEYISEEISWLPALQIFTLIGLAANLVAFSRFGKLLYHSLVRQQSRMGFQPITASLIVGWIFGSFPQSMGWSSFFSAPAWSNLLVSAPFPL